MKLPLKELLDEKLTLDLAPLFLQSLNLVNINICPCFLNIITFLIVVHRAFEHRYSHFSIKFKKYDYINTNVLVTIPGGP